MRQARCSPHALLTQIAPALTRSNHSAVNLRERRSAWRKTGWNTFDPASKPNGAEEVRKERKLYGAGR